METDNVRLVDIGNSFVKVYENNKIKRIKLEDFTLLENDYFISVNPNFIPKYPKNDLAKCFDISSNYKGLGIDRKVLCYLINDGVIVDAGSAITIDVMEKKTHLGGYILPGLYSYKKLFKSISTRLEVEFKKDITLEELKKLPKNTNEALSFGVLYSLVLLIKDISKDKKIYFCGGDGEFLSRFFENSIYKEDLIFEAMKKIIKDFRC